MLNITKKLKYKNNNIRSYLFFQYHHGESFLGQNSAAPPGSWLSHRLPGSTGPTAAGVGSTSSSTIPGIPATNPSFVDTGLSPPPSSNNSNVAADEQPQLKPLHINNNIPSSYPNSTSTGQHVNTNTPTPPSSAEAISPSSVSSGKPPFFFRVIFLAKRVCSTALVDYESFI